MQETTPITPAEIDPKRRYRCRHVFTEGHRCGSPSLRGQDLCYYHHASRREPSLANRNGYFLMPRIDDRPAIQIALYDVLARLSQFDIDPKRAGMLLYGLQIASSNLARHDKSAANTEPIVEEIVPNIFLGDLAPIEEIPEREPAPVPIVPSPNIVILSVAKNPRIQPEAPPNSKATKPPAPAEDSAFEPLTSNLNPRTSNLRRPITLAAVAHQTARTCRRLKLRTANLEPEPSNLEPPQTPPTLSPIHNALQ